MKSSHAPPGCHTEVDIKVTLKGARRHERHWSTPIAIAPAYHKALGWIVDELRAAGAPGRTCVERIQLEVRYVEGEYVDGEPT